MSLQIILDEERHYICTLKSKIMAQGENPVFRITKKVYAFE